MIDSLFVYLSHEGLLIYREEIFQRDNPLCESAYVNRII
jgi:hypothetical protein